MRPTSKRETQTNWAHIAEAGSSAGIWFLFQVHRWLGRLPFRLILYPVMLYFFITKRVARRASIEYLKQIQPFTQNIRPNLWTAYRHFLSFGDALLDKLLAHTGHFTLNSVKVTGREPVQACIDNGQGFVLLTAHLGNLEVSRTLAKYRRIPLNILVHTRHAERFNKILKKLDPQSQVNLIQVTELNALLAIDLAQKVQAGEAVVIAADRVPVSGDLKHMVSTEFFGRPAYFPTGPYILAHVLQVPVFFVTCTHRRRVYHLHYEVFAERIELPRTNRAQAMTHYVQKFAALLESHCKQAPLQWFNFYPFWHNKS